MKDWISIVGTIASICSAGWAYVEARKSSRHASKAEEIKNELIDRRVIIEVSRLHSETSKILKIVSQVGPTSTSANLRGVNCNNIAKEIEEYARFLNEHSSHFTVFFQNKAKELCSILAPHIEKLSEAKTFDEKKSSGKEIYHAINNFMPEIKQLSDDKKESVRIA